MSETITRNAERVMSCEATVTAVSERLDSATLDGLVAGAVRRLRQIESRWSRFIADSELSRINLGGGVPVDVSSDTMTLVEAMVHGWHATDGAFDPTLLATLVELGYGQSRTAPDRRTSLPVGAARRGSPRAIVVDRGTGTVRLPAGTTIDPGGIGKGLAADLVTAELIADGADGALVEIGGDLRVAGRPPQGTGWWIEVDCGERPLMVGLAEGGVATSTSRLRTWGTGGRCCHHLIDPTTLRSSATDSVSCTVIAGTAAWAEVFTKVAFTAGAPVAIDALGRHGLAASITTGTGERLVTSSWEEFER